MRPRQIADQLEGWLRRVEVLARGGERLRQASLSALAAGRPWEALVPAQELLELAPASPSALLLWADVAQASGLSVEACDALTRLAPLLPHRADVWYRLAEAEGGQGLSPQLALERAEEAGAPREAADAARIWLCDLDLDRGDVARAARWLERVGLTARESSAWRWRRVEVLLDSGRVEEALSVARAAPEPEVLDGYGWLMRGRAWAAAGDPSAGWALTRALLLEAPRVGPAIAEHLVRADDAVLIARVKEVVQALGWQAHPGWRAAFAEAEGRREDALSALAEGAAEGASVAWLQRYAALAVRTRSAEHLALAGAALLSQRAALSEEQLALHQGASTTGTARLDALLGRSLASDPYQVSWADELIEEALTSCLMPGGARELFSWVQGLTVAAEATHAAEQLAELLADLERPLRVAVVGEFNAGKSSFINAWLGEELTQVGVVPTTAKSHRLAFARDPYLRLELAHGDARILPLTPEAARLARSAEVQGVVIYTPREVLREVELIDTPGFNSGHAEHTRAVMEAAHEAHVALWLLDATQPLSQSELGRLVALSERGLALIAVVNKLDRLGEAERAACLLHVHAGLREAQLKLAYPLIGISARKAMAASTRADSGFEQVEALLTTLRRDAKEHRSARLQAELVRLLAELPEAPPCVTVEPPERRLAAAIEAGALAEPLRETRAALTSDLLPLRRELARAELDDAGRLYAAARARTRLLAALAPLVDASGITGLKRAELLGLMGGFAAAGYRGLWFGEAGGAGLSALLLAWCRDEAASAGLERHHLQGTAEVALEPVAAVPKPTAIETAGAAPPARPAPVGLGGGAAAPERTRAHALRLLHALRRRLVARAVRST